MSERTMSGRLDDQGDSRLVRAKQEHCNPGRICTCGAATTRGAMLHMELYQESQEPSSGSQGDRDDILACAWKPDVPSAVQLRSIRRKPTTIPVQPYPKHEICLMHGGEGIVECLHGRFRRKRKRKRKWFSILWRLVSFPLMPWSLFLRFFHICKRLWKVRLSLRLFYSMRLGIMS